MWDKTFNWVKIETFKNHRGKGLLTIVHLVWMAPNNHFSNSLKSFTNLPIRLLKETFWVLNDNLTMPTVVHRVARQPAQRGTQVPYERRRPDEPPLYQVVQEHVEIFFAQVELETGAGLPKFVKDEFEAFLECGILAHGFLRLRCGTCSKNTFVAFSCKRRGFCPSCGARRMAETAAHLVDHVIPHVHVGICFRRCYRSSTGPSPPF